MYNVKLTDLLYNVNDTCRFTMCQAHWLFKYCVLICRRSEDLRHELEQRRRDDSRYLGQGDGRRYDRGDSDR
jgi:hypothetical protein